MNRLKTALLLMMLGILGAGEVALFRGQVLQRQFNHDVAESISTMAHYIGWKLGAPGDE